MNPSPSRSRFTRINLTNEASRWLVKQTQRTAVMGLGSLCRVQEGVRKLSKKSNLLPKARIAGTAITGVLSAILLKLSQNSLRGRGMQRGRGSPWVRTLIRQTVAARSDTPGGKMTQRPQRITPGDQAYKPPAPATATAAASLSAEPPPLILTPDWRLVFNDDFATSNLDTNKWWTRYVYNNGMLDYLNDEWQRYRESGNHVMSDGLLHLTAQPHNGEFWPSGMLRSKDCYPITNGDDWYFEARMKVPNFLGSWSAFWVAASEPVPGSDAVPWPPEIDQCEVVNNGQDDTTQMLHCGGQVNNWGTNPQNYFVTWAAPNFNLQWMYYWVDPPLSDEFHLYGLFYSKGSMTIYLDRQPILAASYAWVADDGAVMPGCYLFANLAVGGSWAGRYGVDNAGLPQSLDIDYIRAYTRIPQSTVGHDLMPQ